MTQQRERFDQYMNAPCSELPADDCGRDDPHHMPFQEWGVPQEFLLWLWQAAEAAALERAAQRCDEIADELVALHELEPAIGAIKCREELRALAAPVERGGDKS